MRLLQRESNGEFSLTMDFKSPPAYAILSHTWGKDDQEVTFLDLTERSGRSKAGNQKIRFCGEQAARDGLRYFWVDTCCIDKSDPVELQRSINSMFRWYKNAVKCYVYLSDVSIPDNRVESYDFESTFQSAGWFDRGWTLQELLAPSSVEFFSANGKRLGDKLSLERLIHERTGIPVEALQRYDPAKFSIEERVSWVSKRETKYEEDMAYSLLGIFGIFLPLIYGEGRENAFRRLREEASKSVKSYEFDKLPKPSIENQPKFTVPFVRDSKFVGREEIMQEITNRLEMQRRIALCGIGGIGKTQIAIEYCYAWKYRYPDRHVFWVHASTFDRFEHAYRDIAKEISIPGTEDPQNDTLILVRNWLNKPESGSWLIVLDNADDLDLFFQVNMSAATEQKNPPISTFLPQNANGVMITTTRDKRIGQRLTDREEEIIIPPLALRDAEQLLRSRISRSESENVGNEDIHVLVEILGNIPLAITQAAAFIRENSMMVQTYIEELRASDSDLQDYLDESLPDPRRYPDSENSVIRTWKLSFDQIAKHMPRAADLLSLMVQLDRQAIPKALLKHKNDRNIEFNKALGTLQAYSLIKTEKSGSSFEIHRLVQLSMRRWLSLQQKQIEWQQKGLELMIEKFPSGDYGTWEECRSLFLHAKRVAKYTCTHNRCIQRAELLERIATYDESQGKYAEAETIRRQTLKLREEVLGKTHPETLTTMNNLAGVLDLQGKYAEAETISRQTLKLREEVLGKTHPETLTTMNNLAGVLDLQGKYAEAETISRQTLKLREEVLGKTHPETLTTMNNLAGVLDSQGKYAEAETINRQTLKLREEVLGKTHPETLTTMNNLALVLNSQGKYAEAETINRQTLKLLEEVLGKTHPETLTTINNLALVLNSQGKYAEAETIDRQTLKLSEEVLGKTHPSTLTTMNNLALVLNRQGKYAEAETINRQTLKLREEVLGKTHPETLTSMNNLAGVLNRQGKYAEAETINRQTLKLKEEVLGKTHPLTLTSMNNLAGVLNCQGKYAEAETINRQTLKLLEEVLGKTHPDTLTSVYCLAYILQFKQEYEEASKLYQRAIDGYKLTLGAEHPTTIACIRHYSAILENIGDRNQSKN